jgi:hypothetical protein
MMHPEMREELGKMVRAVWDQWARQHPNPQPHWLTPWEELSDDYREVDRQIGEALYRAGYADGYKDGVDREQNYV